MVTTTLIKFAITRIITTIAAGVTACAFAGKLVSTFRRDNSRIDVYIFAGII
jgi:hypothetical protein